MRDIDAFQGFLTPTQATPVPEAFFAEILPRLTSAEEIKLFLVALRRIRGRKGAIRFVTAREMANAPELGELADAVAAEPTLDDRNSGEAVPLIMADFVRAGVFLEVELADGDTAYFVNDSEGRRAAERVRAGDAELSPKRLRAHAEEPPSQPGEIFRLYEDTIGPIPGAGIAQELSETEQEYPATWIREAFQEAAAQNARRWAYVRSILRNWRDRGRGDGTTQRRPAKDRYRGGEYGQVVRWR